MKIGCHSCRHYKPYEQHSSCAKLSQEGLREQKTMQDREIKKAGKRNIPTTP